LNTPVDNYFLKFLSFLVNLQQDKKLLKAVVCFFSFHFYQFTIFTTCLTLQKLTKNLLQFFANVLRYI